MTGGGGLERGLGDSGGGRGGSGGGPGGQNKLDLCVLSRSRTVFGNVKSRLPQPVKSFWCLVVLS